MSVFSDAAQKKLARDFRAVVTDVEDLLRLTTGQHAGLRQHDRGARK